MTNALDLFLRIRARHGHYCPMSTLGGRLGLAALQALGDIRGELTATYHIDTCAADGIAVATGCLRETGRLIVRNEGRHRLELRDGSGGGVSAELMAAALSRAAACRLRLDAGENADAVLAVLRGGSARELITVAVLGREAADA